MAIEAAETDLQELLGQCPDKPNCVCSLCEGKQHVPPFDAGADAAAGFQRLRELLQSRRDAVVTLSDDRRIQVEFRTQVWKFVDDATFVLDPARGVIHVRSAARLGRYDFGKNRRRLEQLRREFAASKHLAPGQ